MSSILKALKKIEKESEGAGREGTWLANGDVQVSLWQRIQERSRFQPVFLVAAILVVIVGAGLGFLYFRSGPGRTVVAEIDGSSQPAKISGTDVAREKVDAERAPVAPVSRRPALDGRDPSSRTGTSVKEIKPSSDYGHKENFPTVKGSKIEVSSNNELEAPPPRGIGERALPAPVKAPSVSPERTPPPSDEFNRDVRSSEIERYVGEDLDLQAISWASDPHDRMAVINGAIVRQGDRIDRFAIVQINADDVILGLGDAVWRLVFVSR